MWQRILQDHRLRKVVPRGIRRRFDRRERKELKIDIVGSCNLRCPSCPVGNLGYVNPTGLLDLDLFRRILEKADREYQLHMVSLFNWGEPFLHPELPELIRIVRRRGLRCQISSNLNIMRNEEEVLRAEPNRFRISLSGITQETYGKTHARGEIEVVKENMIKLAETYRRVGPNRTRFEVYFHKYRNNLHEEQPVREFCESLGFPFNSDWAFHMGYENMMEVIEDRLTPEKRAFVEGEFALPVLEAAREAQRFRDDPCHLIDEQLVVGLDGRLLPCCVIYEQEEHTLGSFLDMTTADVREAKQGLDVCGTCTKHGLHKYFTYYDDPRLNQIYEDLMRQRMADGLLPSPARATAAQARHAQPGR